MSQNAGGGKTGGVRAPLPAWGAEMDGFAAPAMTGWRYSGLKTRLYQAMNGSAAMGLLMRKPSA
jgi:hypothetical protein